MQGAVSVDLSGQRTRCGEDRQAANSAQDGVAFSGLALRLRSAFWKLNRGTRCGKCTLCTLMYGKLTNNV